MTRILRQIWPAFLHRLDHRLLTHYPIIWASRIHVLFFGWLAILFLLMLRAFTTSFGHMPDVESSFAVISILAGLVWLLWFISMYRFRPGRHLLSMSNGLTQLLTVLGGTLLIVSLPFLYGMGLGLKYDLYESNKQGEIHEAYELLKEGDLYFTTSQRELARSQNIFEMRRQEDLLGSDQLPKLELAMALFEKYGGDLQSITAKELLQAAQRNEVALPPKYEKEKEKVLQNARRHDRMARFYEEMSSWVSFRSNKPVVHVLLFFIILVGLASVVLLQTNFKKFFLAILSLVLIGIVIGVLSFINEISGIRAEGEVVVSGLIMLAYFGVGLLALGKVKPFKNFQKVALIAWVLALPFLGLELGFFADEVLHLRFPKFISGRPNELLFLFQLPAWASIFIWLSVCFPQFKRLNSAPE